MLGQAWIQSHICKLGVFSRQGQGSESIRRKELCWGANVKILETIPQVMSGKLEELIEEINGRQGEKIDCVIADGVMGWAIEVAKRLKIKQAAVWTSSAASLALSFSIPKLNDDRIIDSEGTPMKKQRIQLAPNMPAMYSPTDLFWASADLATQKIIFDFTVNNAKAMKMSDWLICNSTYDLEPAAIAMVPKLLPIGPLLASNRLGNSAGYFWPEDSNCLKWLDRQQPNSVIYVAFGSSTVFDKIQFQELALGLELCNMPFLWVVRSDILTNDANDAYPEGFQDSSQSQPDGGLGAAARGSEPPFSCLFLEPLWLEFRLTMLNNSWTRATFVMIGRWYSSLTKAKVGSSQEKKLRTRWIKFLVMKTSKQEPWNSRKKYLVSEKVVPPTRHFRILLNGSRHRHWKKTN